MWKISFVRAVLYKMWHCALYSCLPEKEENEPEKDESLPATAPLAIDDSNLQSDVRGRVVPTCNDQSEPVRDNESIPDSVNQAASVSIQSSTKYRGEILDIAYLVRKYPDLEKIIVSEKSRKQTHVKCNACSEFEHAARGTSKNGTIPIASGVQADSNEKLMRVVDHLHSSIHSNSLEHRKLQNLLKEKQFHHPWISLLKKQEAAVWEYLVRLAFDVYNDALCETTSAYSWPSRSLTQLAADSFINTIRDNGFDVNVPSFKPSESQLH